MVKKTLAYINTYNRTDTTLPLAILSVINQTHKPDALIIFDDNTEFKNPLENPTLKYLLDLSMQKGIQWHWLPGERKGAHFNHERANLMGYDFNWFLDDDHVAEPSCLEKLMKEMKDNVGAVGGLILKTPVEPKPNDLKTSKIDDVWSGRNIQWYSWAGKPIEVEHLYSSFLYRPNISHWDLRLSRKTFRGETMFTHAFFLRGYKLIITPNSITWHFESDGGCRTSEDSMTMYNDDDVKFQDWLKFKRTGKKLYVVDGGLGDHYMFLQTFPLEKDAIYAVCYPDLFKGYETMSIADAEKIIDRKMYNPYDWATMNNWTGTYVEALKKIYENITV